MPTYSPDALTPQWLRCDVCGLVVAVAKQSSPPTAPGLTAPQVAAARPEVATFVSLHDAACRGAVQKGRTP